MNVLQKKIKLNDQVMKTIELILFKITFRILDIVTDKSKCSDDDCEDLGSENINLLFFVFI